MSDTADMALREPLGKETHTILILGVQVAATFTVFRDYMVSVDLTVLGTPYTFNITRWTGKGQAAFAKLFHEFTPRDEAQFGAVVEQADGSVQVNMNVTQKADMVKQGAFDVMDCINTIGESYKRMLLDYAVWHRERYPAPSTYSEYITLCACHCLVHSNFLAPNINFIPVMWPTPHVLPIDLAHVDMAGDN